MRRRLDIMADDRVESMQLNSKKGTQIDGNEEEDIQYLEKWNK